VIAARRRTDHGFTLVELLSVVAILGILVAIAVASYSVSIERSRRVACLHNQRLLGSAVEAYRAQTGNAPANLEVLRPYVRWPDPRFGRCASDTSLDLILDPDGTVSCSIHQR
jgi:prepilin-type N-terminal cleavage/methylation domain-containing protein